MKAATWHRGGRLLDTVLLLFIKKLKVFGYLMLNVERERNREMNEGGGGCCGAGDGGGGLWRW